MPNWTGGTGRAGTWLEICAAFMCRVDECYHLFFQEMMTYEEYIRLNKEACKLLKE